MLCKICQSEWITILNNFEIRLTQWAICTKNCLNISDISYFKKLCLNSLILIYRLKKTILNNCETFFGTNLLLWLGMSSWRHDKNTLVAPLTGLFLETKCTVGVFSNFSSCSNKLVTKPKLFLCFFYNFGLLFLGPKNHSS